MPLTRIKTTAIDHVFLSEFLGTVASESAMLALVGGIGDYAVRSDLNNDAFIITQNNGSSIGDWQKISNTSTALLKSENLSDLSDAAAARGSLGLGTAATTNSTAYATAAQGATADSNATAIAGLGTASANATTDFLQVANNLSDLNADTALTNLGFSTFGKNLIDDADSSTLKSLIFASTATSVTGGTDASGNSLSPINYTDGYTYHIFKSDGNFEIVGGSLDLEFILIGGGGPGGSGSGGGAGGLINNSIRLSPGIYKVGIGAGGLTAQAGSVTAMQGEPSSFANHTAFGGGAGKGGVAGNHQLASGGSGGGGWGYPYNNSRAAGKGMYGQGHDGGDGNGWGGSGDNGGGGGGGAGAPGTTAGGSGTGLGGNGGDGLQFSDWATATSTGRDGGYYAGGGGGTDGGSHGLGGGGGAANTGGGGYSVWNSSTQTHQNYAGGSGLCLIRYTTL